MSHGHNFSFIPRSEKHTADLKRRHKFYNIIKALKKKQQDNWTYDTHLKIIELERKVSGEVFPNSKQKNTKKKKNNLNKLI